jgi:hypothetical protein
MKEMFDIEMAEARKLIEDIKREAVSANGKLQQAELEVKKQRARYTEISNLREVDRKEVDAIERQIAENQAVRFQFTIILENSRRYTNDFSGRFITIVN